MAQTVVWVNTRRDPVPVALGRLRKTLVGLRPGARSVVVKTRSRDTVVAIEDWCRQQGVIGRVEDYGDGAGWVVRLCLLPDTLGGRFVARLPESALQAA
jgi:hypothetical protein